MSRCEKLVFSRYSGGFMAERKKALWRCLLAPFGGANTVETLLSISAALRVVD